MIACEMVHHTASPFILKSGNADVHVVIRYEKGPVNFTVSPTVRLYGACV